MGLHGARCLHVIGRLEVVRERVDRRLDVAVRQRRFGAPRAHWRRADAEIDEAEIAEPLAGGARAGGKSHHRVVAMAAGKLGETDAGVGARSRDTDGGEHIARRKRGLEQALEEIIGFDRELPLRPDDFDFATERDDACRQFGGRIGEGERAADGAAVADRGVADMRQRQRDERRRLRDLGGAFRLRVPHQRADLDVGVFQRDPVEPADAVDVDQQRGLAQPHIERGDQALPAGEQPRIVVGEQLDRVGDRASLGIGKRCRLQIRPPGGAYRLSVLSLPRASRQSLRRGQMEEDGATIPSTMSIARRISVSEASSVRKAAWEVTVTFSMRASGWSGLSGSAWKTSSPAWRTWPLASAWSSAVSSTSAPRAVLTRITPRLVPARRLASMKPRVSSLRARCSEITSARAKSSSRPTSGTPTSGRAERFQPITSMPTPRAIRATSRPMPPSPMSPSVLPLSCMLSSGSHTPRRTARSMRARSRQQANISAIVCSATATSP